MSHNNRYDPNVPVELTKFNVICECCRINSI